MSETVVDLGCGDNPIEGAIGVDLLPYENADLRANVCDLPLESNSIDRLHASQLFEHLSADQIAEALEEADRVLKSGGELVFDVPHGREWDGDPTHKTKWRFKTIVYYLPRDEVARLGWNPDTFPDYFSEYQHDFDLVDRDAIAWIDAEWFPWRVFSFGLRKLSERVTTDRWDGLPLGSALLTFTLRKR